MMVLWKNAVTYEADPIADLSQQGIDLLINIAASPYFLNKEVVRYPADGQQRAGIWGSSDDPTRAPMMNSFLTGRACWWTGREDSSPPGSLRGGCAAG